MNVVPEESWSEEGLVEKEALEARAPNLLGAMMLDAVLVSPLSLIRFGELRIANGLLLAPVSNSFGLENIGPTKQTLIKFSFILSSIILSSFQRFAVLFHFHHTCWIIC